MFLSNGRANHSDLDRIHRDATDFRYVQQEPQKCCGLEVSPGKTKPKSFNSLADVGKTAQRGDPVLHDLIIPVNGIYFDQIAARTEFHGFRLQSRRSVKTAGYW